MRLHVLALSGLFFLSFFISALHAYNPAIDAASFIIRNTMKNKKRQQRRAALDAERKAPLSYVEAGSNQWNRKVLCLICGDKLYMFKHADYLGDRGNVFQLANHPAEHYPTYAFFGIRNNSYCTFPQRAVVEGPKGLAAVHLWKEEQVPDVAAINFREKTVFLRTGKSIPLSKFDLPKEIVISRKRKKGYDDGFGGATRYLHDELFERIALANKVDWLFWRYHASMVSALKDCYVQQSFVRPFEFTIRKDKLPR